MSQNIFGCQPVDSTTFGFNLYAPKAKQVFLKLVEQDKVIPLEKSPDGIWQTNCNAVVGEHYYFSLDQDHWFPDPASKYQPNGVHQSSQIIDNNYDWRANHFKGLEWYKTILYELHVGTFTYEGTFRAIIPELNRLKKIGINTIELMPIADFAGRWNWGYDGVQLFSPSRCYGHPNDLKALIDAAHQLEMQVILDVVYNHFGPEGNYLWHTATDFFNKSRKTLWGGALNFKSKALRQFFIQNALYWLNEFKFDGLRLDAIHAIRDKSKQHFIDELFETINQYALNNNRTIHLIVENHLNETRWLKDEGKKHYASQWNEDLHHAAHVILTSEKGSYYTDYHKETSHLNTYQHLAKCLAKGFSFQGEKSLIAHRVDQTRGDVVDNIPLSSFVSYLQNHDMVGNRPFAERLKTLTSQKALDALTTIILLSPQIPMLFMGEETGETRPFYYFCDLAPSLQSGVRKGRLKSLEILPELNPTEIKLIDCFSEEAFQQSKLSSHGTTSLLIQNLLAIRQKHLTHLIPNITTEHSVWFATESGLVAVAWRTNTGETWGILANLSNNTQETYSLNSFYSNHLKGCTYKLTGAPLQSVANTNMAKSLYPWEVSVFYAV